MRLVFSEAVVAELSQIALTTPAGGYRVAWRIVSADGHPVAGNFSFSLIAAALDSALPLPINPQAISGSSASAPTAEIEERPTPRGVSLLRGLGLGAMMSGVGLLFFGSAAGSRRNLNPSSLVTRFLALGALLLAGHMAAWLYHISPGKGLSETFGASALVSTPGMVESARVVLAALSFWAIAGGRRRLALMLGVACLAVSGSIGHSAAIEPMFAIPAKIVHLIAAAVWLGGLLWLAWTFRRDVTAFRIEARRVSFAALIALVIVASSGIVQAFLFLDWPWDLFRTDYGTLVLAKIGGLLVLTLLGGYNRFRLVPHLDDSRNGRKLSRSVTQEIAIMTAIILIAGFLANVPVPAPSAARAIPASAAR